MQSEITFGDFIRQQRLKTDISMREMALRLDVNSSGYISDIESGKKPAPSNDILAKYAQILNLDKSEQNMMYDLAAKSRKNKVAPGDLPSYINSREYVRIALRAAKDYDATDEELMEFVEKLKKRSTEQAAFNKGQEPNL